MIKLDAGERELLNRDIAAVVRLLDRVTVRRREEADASSPDAGAAPEIPTSSTKTAPGKGKT